MLKNKKGAILNVLLVFYGLINVWHCILSFKILYFFFSRALCLIHRFNVSSLPHNSLLTYNEQW